MTLLAAIVLFTMISMVVGKRTKRITGGSYVAIALITIAQVGFVLYEMFVMEVPKP